MYIIAAKNLARQRLVTSPVLELQQSLATLIIFPLPNLFNWEREMKIHCAAGTFSYSIFYGRHQSEISIEQLLSSTVVLTTYNMIGTGSQDKENPMIASLNIDWFRIVLVDEAQ